METNNQSQETRFAELISLCAKKRILKKAVFSKSLDKRIIRAVITKKLISGNEVLQAESFTADNKALHRNIPAEDTVALTELISGFSQVNLITTAGDAELKRSKNGKLTLIGDKKLHTKIESGNADELPERGNDDEKSHILSGNEPFLKLLGISDTNGRIYDKKQLKFRQINRFVEMIRDVEANLPTGKITICDLCCGKSYLSFAVYHYFANVKGCEVSMTGVDLKSDVVKNCSDAAKTLGFDGLEFVCADIRDYHSEQKPGTRGEIE